MADDNDWKQYDRHLDASEAPPIAAVLAEAEKACLARLAERDADIERLRAEAAEAQELIEELTWQGTWGDDHKFDSQAISTYADALRWLAGRGVVEIEHDAGRRVIAVPAPKGGERAD